MWISFCFYSTSIWWITTTCDRNTIQIWKTTCGKCDLNSFFLFLIWKQMIWYTDCRSDVNDNKHESDQYSRTKDVMQSRAQHEWLQLQDWLYWWSIVYRNSSGAEKLQLITRVLPRAVRRSLDSVVNKRHPDSSPLPEGKQLRHSTIHFFNLFSQSCVLRVSSSFMCFLAGVNLRKVLDSQRHLLCWSDSSLFLFLNLKYENTQTNTDPKNSAVVLLGVPCPGGLWMFGARVFSVPASCLAGWGCCSPHTLLNIYMEEPYEHKRAHTHKCTLKHSHWYKNRCSQTHIVLICCCFKTYFVILVMCAAQ